MRYILTTITLFLLFAVAINAQEILSPNKNIKVILDTKKESGQAYFKVLYKENNKYVEVLPNSPLGIVRNDQQFATNLKLVDVSQKSTVHDKYELVSGKKTTCENFGTQCAFNYLNSNNQPFTIVFRVYNDGVAFRYQFDNKSNPVIITAEATSFVLPDSTNCWMQPFNNAYEDFFLHSKIGSKTGRDWALPALYKVNNNDVWVLISEANIAKNNCATKLSNVDKPNEYKVSYPSPRKEFNQTGVITSLPWQSQWHTLIIGRLTDIVESTLITDVSEPNTIGETGWIKPGVVSWIYWANNHGSKDYKKVVEYTDLAVEMKWPYMLIDWEWDQMSNGGTIIQAVNYAKSKGVKPLLWYNSGTSWLGATPHDRLLTPEKRAKEFSWLNSIGVYGIKVDFFAGDQQDMMKYYIDILEDAANYHLMVNFHGATAPRGWARTFPNLMTTEGVYGAEWYNNSAVLTNKAACHNTTLPFTRNVVGSMDYTPVTFSNSQHPHITSYGHELALSVVFESGFQHFADRPSAYNALDSEAKEFLKNVPVQWDCTKLLGGYPGEKVIVARKKDNQWFLGGLNGKDEATKLQVKLNFLKKGNYTLKIISDGANDKTFTIKKMSIKNGDSLNIECLPRGGFVGVLEKE